MFRVSYLCDISFFSTMVINASINYKKNLWSLETVSENGIFPNDYAVLHLYHASGWLMHGETTEKLLLLSRVYDCIHDAFGDTIMNHKVGRSFSYKTNFVLSDAHLCKRIMTSLSPDIQTIILQDAKACRGLLTNGKYCIYHKI